MTEITIGIIFMFLANVLIGIGINVTLNASNPQEKKIGIIILLRGIIIHFLLNTFLKLPMFVLAATMSWGYFTGIISIPSILILIHGRKGFKKTKEILKASVFILVFTLLMTLLI